MMMIHKQSSNWSTLRRAFELLTKRDRRKLLAVFLLQIFLGLVDLIGVALIGILGALTVSGIQSKSPSGISSTAISLLQLDNFTFQIQAAILGVSAGSLLMLRTVLSIVSTRKSLFFLSRKGSEISRHLIATLFRQPLSLVYRKSTQETLYVVTTGVTQITVGLIGTSLVLSADTFLVAIMSIGLFIVEPVVALISTAFFSLFAFILYGYMKNKTYQLGLNNTDLTVKGNELTLEAIISYREATVRGTRQRYAKQIGQYRADLADTLAELAFMPSVSKYAIESALVLGALLLSGAQFYLYDASRAIATLSIFMAAGSRIAPAILRIQQGALQIKGAAATSSPTLNLIDELSPLNDIESGNNQFMDVHPGFKGEIILKNISFTYPGKDLPTIDCVNLSVSHGEFVAIVGPSGAGKSTLMDVILGVALPSTGEVLVSGLHPIDAISKWPGAVSYMPQEAFITNGTILENILLGYDHDQVPSDSIHKVLKKAYLDEFVSSLDDGLGASVGERGSKLSGGQRQRLAIARSLITKPDLLILDEATSSLDSNSEQMITRAILELRGSTTLVVIAHRLSTVQKADKVVYIENGLIQAIGSFNEVRNQVQNFDEQAKLMGL
jgi:ABC-type multidrug transport system fused ATPase/permease subunit